MVKVKIKRLWHGSASIRNYIVESAMAKKEDVEIALLSTEEKMTIPYSKLREGRYSPDMFFSKHNNLQQYQLVDFKWKPDRDRQKKLL